MHWVLNTLACAGSLRVKMVEHLGGLLHGFFRISCSFGTSHDKLRSPLALELRLLRRFYPNLVALIGLIG